MKVSINKIAYNIFELYPNSETISVDIAAKFGASKTDYSNRAFFLELNMDGKDESGEATRKLFLAATFHYQIDKKLFPDIDKNEIEEDSKYFYEFLKRLNNIIVNITSQDDTERPLNIEQAVENYEI